MTQYNLIPDLQKSLEVSFIQEPLFHLVEDKEAYKDFLVVNHHNSYLGLSNEDHYIFLLPIVSSQIVEEVTEASNYIFNRKKILVQLETCEDIPGFEHHFCIKVTDIILQAEKNGVPKNNLFLRLLKEIFEPTPVTSSGLPDPTGRACPNHRAGRPEP
ncbi:MAG TPA: hypothetical protein VLO29_06490 [Salegentibacter sp.]|nr:hypothetical protein [Salegentibacter sp.]